MNENIDLTEILKDCPIGWKFYSSIYGDVTFYKIESDSHYPIVFSFDDTQNIERSSSVTKQGLVEFYCSGECTFFPSKDQRDWSKFTAPWLKKEKDTIAWIEEQGEQEEPQVYETEDGEIITYSETDGYKFVEPNFHEGDWVVRGDTIAQIVNIQEQYYVGLDINGKDFVSSRFLNGDKIHLWTIQDAKDGDVLALSWMEDINFWEKIIIFKKYHSEGIKGLYTMPCVEGYGITFKNGKMAFTEKVPYYSKTWTCNLHPATKEQRGLLFQKIKETGYKWNTETNTFEKLVEPKFKVGDRIRHKETNKDDVYEISKVYDDSYGIAGFTWMIYMKYQDQYELVPNKFDPKTLKPFDNVLVRDSYGDTWKHRLFSHINKNEKFPYMCIEHAFSYCIPYNNDTKHLESTTEEAPDYYRYWED